LAWQRRHNNPVGNEQQLPSANHGKRYWPPKRTGMTMAALAAGNRDDAEMNQEIGETVQPFSHIIIPILN
jgi:hypothetical protein